MTRKPPQIQTECMLFLLDNSLKSIPFNDLLSFIITFYLMYRGVPSHWAFLWFTVMVFLSLSRFFYTTYCIKSKKYVADEKTTKIIFVLLTGLTGAAWGLCYLFCYSYLLAMHHNIITLVLGGMASGALASLSIYLPAYYAYILFMFVPIIVYNYWLGDVDHIILATMFSLFVIMLMITAQLPCKLLQKTIRLDKEKDEALNEIKQLSITDSLTGLYNRRYFDQRLSEEINHAKKNNQSLNLMFIDVDDFKLINDRYGHPAGDLFLIELARIMKKVLQRDDDVSFRIGGDEFAAILTNISLDEALLLCKNLKEHVHQTGIVVKTSISIGIVSVSPASMENVERVISEADKTLYQAKKEGKDQVCCHKISNRG
ncbi:MAG: hypothetical protein BGO90_09045 [Legionella sp. 40-6]|nr:GGDEF domain-containing protein [Legionella sp.]OJX87836.1 MAG: hypothetical protein BGO90_09045 [Legionella sp. 40-6]